MRRGIRLGSQDTENHYRRSIMKSKTIIAAAVGAVLSIGLAAGIVYAHPYGYGPGGGMGGGPGYGMGYRGGPGYGNPAAAMEGRLAYLKTELKITQAQEPAWKKFSDEARKQAESMQAARTAMWSSANANAADRAELHNQLMKSRLEQSEKTAAAFKELYAALTPEQKALADEHPGMGFGPGYGGGPRGRFR
jgi:Spy/CpxP family protein refolding chaperone